MKKCNSYLAFEQGGKIRNDLFIPNCCKLRILRCRAIWWSESTFRLFYWRFESYYKQQTWKLCTKGSKYWQPIIVTIERALDNFAFIWQKYYIIIISAEASRQGNNTPNENSKSTLLKEDIIATWKIYYNNFDLDVNSPVQRLHEVTFGDRFIVAWWFSNSKTNFILV